MEVGIDDQDPEGAYSQSTTIVLGNDPLLWSEDNVYIWMHLVAQQLNLDSTKVIIH